MTPDIMQRAKKRLKLANQLQQYVQGLQAGQQDPTSGGVVGPPSRVGRTGGGRPYLPRQARPQRPPLSNMVRSGVQDQTMEQALTRRLTGEEAQLQQTQPRRRRRASLSYG